MQLTEAQLRNIIAGLEKVVDGPGFGTLEIVVEKHRVVRIRTTVEQWIDRPAKPESSQQCESPR
jgi:hypothetical protein